MSAQASVLPDGRLHLNDGPIDLVCQAWGTPDAVRAAFEAAAAEFPTILPALCAELRHLRRPIPSAPAIHPIARAMHQAVSSLLRSRPEYRTLEHDMYASLLNVHALDGVDGRDEPGQDVGKSGEAFITPMAAVAGAVADHVLATMTAAAPLAKAYANNGGDIAFHLTSPHHLTCGLITTLADPTLDGAFHLHHQNPARGIATSGQACKGRGGKSFSFGIADSVTILARTAAQADAAATIVANAVDLPGHPGIERRPADSIDPDTDLGRRLITWRVPPLTLPEIERSLDKGRQTAEHMIRAGLIDGAVLALQGRVVTCLPAYRELAA